MYMYRYMTQVTFVGPTFLNALLARDDGAANAYALLNAPQRLQCYTARLPTNDHTTETHAPRRRSNYHPLYTLLDMNLLTSSAKC